MKFFREPRNIGTVLLGAGVFSLGAAALAGVRSLVSPAGLIITLLTLAVLGAVFSLHRQCARIRGQRRDAEEKRRFTGAFLAQLFDAAADGMRVIDRSCTMVHVNEGFARMAGRSPGDLVGRKCHEVFPDSRCHTPECPLIRIERGETRVEYEAPLPLGPGGESRSCWITSVPFRDEQGGLTGILETWRDTTERARDEIVMQQALEDAHKLAAELAATNDHIRSQQKELEQTHARLKQTQARILQQEKMASIGQLAAGVAHEINNPMSFISSNLNSLLKYLDRLAGYLREVEERLPPEIRAGELAALRKKLKIDFIAGDSRHLVEESLEGAERVKTIVQGLRSFSRIDQAQRVAADINECLESTINIIWNELKYRCEVQKEYGDLPRTVCNPQQLNQVFMNLLLNAAQAIEKQGVIRIRTWAEGGWVHVAISDTGSGIPADKINRIFEPFFTTKEVGKGTGLGLSIVYDIVKKHKGDIQVESEAGKGTTFTVRVPLVEKVE